MLNNKRGAYINDRGFTLVELLIVASITALIATFIVLNFSNLRINLDQTVNIFISKIRSAQALAQASAKFNGAIRCGYGVHYINSNSFIVFAGANATTTDCTSTSRTWSSDLPTVSTINVPNLRVEIKNYDGHNFKDVFFEPPNPKSYINGDDESGKSTGIVIGVKGDSCNSSNCKVICIYNPGRIEFKAGNSPCN